MKMYYSLTIRNRLKYDLHLFFERLNHKTQIELIHYEAYKKLF